MSGILASVVEVRRVLYRLPDGKTTPAVLYGTLPGVGNLLIVDLTTEEGKKVIDLPQSENPRLVWFNSEYTKHWNGLVPECCQYGSEPGDWCEIEDCK